MSRLRDDASDYAGTAAPDAPLFTPGRSGAAPKEPYTEREVAVYYEHRVPHLRQRGREWRGPCPVHQGKDDNFAVNAETGAWFCHSQCQRGGSMVDLEMELGGSDFKEAATEVDRIVGRAPRPDRRIVATYDYEDQQGALIFQVVRYDPKDFRQRRPDGRGGWIWKTKGVPQVLYRLPRLKDAETVLVVEGEKDVASLERLGFTATCNPGGAGKWRKEHARALTGKRVIIVPDNDQPGREHADQVVDSLRQGAREIRIVTVPSGKDVSDWIAAGATKEAIEAAIAAAPNPIDTSASPKSPASDSAGDNDGVERRLPRIIVSDRQLRDLSDDCLSALRVANVPPFLFVRDARLVGLRVNETGRHLLQELSDVQLRGHMARCASFYAETESGLKNCPPPLYAAKDILGLADLRTKFEAVEAVTEIPVLRPDGTVLDQPGYDSATKLYYAPAAGLEFPPVPATPTHADVEKALQLIDSAICDFPFVYDVTADHTFVPNELRDQADLIFSSSRANVIGTLVTPFVRPAMDGPTPLGAITAPAPGTGKTLLAEEIALVATGRPAPLFSAPRDEDEFRKQITAYLREGVGVIVIDNVRDRLESGQLCKALTATVWADRILGYTQTTMLPVRCLWLATGNNFHVGGDLPRRCYWIRLDAKTSVPHLRTGFTHPNLRAWTLANRGRLITAVLTVVRKWFIDGKPSPLKTKPLGSYESWCEVVGGILEHVGVHGFLAGSAEHPEEADEGSQEAAAFLSALADVFGGRDFTSSDVHALCVQATPPALSAAIPAELAEVRYDAPLFVRRLGRWFADRADRRFGGSQIHVKRARIAHKVQVWQIAQPAGAAPVTIQ